MVGHVYLAIGKEHEIKESHALEISFDFVGDVFVLEIGLDYFLDDVGRVIQFHQFGYVDGLVIIEFENEVSFYKLFESGILNFETDGDEDDEPRGDGSSFGVDANNFLNLGSGVDWHKDGIGIFGVLKGQSL